MSCSQLWAALHQVECWRGLHRERRQNAAVRYRLTSIPCCCFKSYRAPSSPQTNLSHIQREHSLTSFATLDFLFGDIISCYLLLHLYHMSYTYTHINTLYRQKNIPLNLLYFLCVYRHTCSRALPRLAASVISSVNKQTFSLSISLVSTSALSPLPGRGLSVGVVGLREHPRGEPQRRQRRRAHGGRPGGGQRLLPESPAPPTHPPRGRDALRRRRGG